MSRLKLFALLSGLGAILTMTMFFHAGNVGIFNTMIMHIRLNKIIVLFIGSFSVGFSTFIMQKMMRNKIIDSSFFGIASFNVLLLVIIFATFEMSDGITTFYKIYMPFISLAASVAIALIMMLTILKKSAQKSQNIVLLGIIFNYLFMAIAYIFMKKVDQNELSDILDIGMGIINESVNQFVVIALFGIQAFTVVWYQLIYKKINVTNINETLSRNLGNKPKWIKIQQILMVGINISIAFSLIGGVSFLGILAANMTSFITKQSRWSAIVCGIAATFITALAYLLFNCFGDLYFPIGIASSIITVPYFIYKVIRSKYA